MATAAPPPPRRLFLVSVPRTASNLLVKVLNMQRQPNVLTNAKAGYFFQDAWMCAINQGCLSKRLSEWTPSQRAELLAQQQAGLDDLEAVSALALSQNKLAFTKEHASWFANPATILGGLPSSDFRLTFPAAYPDPDTFSATNLTLFPDSYLRSWRFAFLIRHPALAWPSMYRAAHRLAELRVLDVGGIKATAECNMTWRWTRSLYDWCCEHSPADARPVVLDAHDVIHEPAVVLKFCEVTGLDKATVRFDWGDVEEKSGWEGQSGVGSLTGVAMDAAARTMTDTLRASKGVMKEKAPAEVDIDVEAAKWSDEFGEEVAVWLEGLVRGEMADYEYLRDRRLQA